LQSPGRRHFLNGGGFIDSFDSTDPFKSTNSHYDMAKRQYHGDVGLIDSTGSTLNSKRADLAYPRFSLRGDGAG